MGFLSKFEGKMEDTVEGAANRMAGAPLSPVQIAKKAEKQMRREKMVGAGRQYAPTLYTVLVNPDDDERLFGYYPTLAGEIETYLAAKANEQGLMMDGQPLVRFIVDDALKHGKFDVIAEAVASPIVAQLRDEEMQRYGLAPQPVPARGARGGRRAPDYGAPARRNVAQPFVESVQPEHDADDGYGYGSKDDYDSYDGYDRFDEGDAGEWMAGNEPAGEAALFGAPAASRQPAPAVAAGAGIAAASVAGAAEAAADVARPQCAPNTMVFAAGSDQQPVAAPQAAQARLIDTANNRAYTLIASRLMVGRESKNDIVVSDINASRSHAELTRDAQGAWHITDLGSTNGTLVNGFDVASQPLEEGDRITIGTTDFVFTYRK